MHVERWVLSAYKWFDVTRSGHARKKEGLLLFNQTRLNSSHLNAVVPKNPPKSETLFDSS
jgi:hypothetical protein